jgi:hypothetical protein
VAEGVVELHGNRKGGGGMFCAKCRIHGHHIRECWYVGQAGRPRVQMGDRHGQDQVKLSELVAPLCATQVEGQGFFLIPSRPS